MVKILASISAVLLAFAAFVAYKNQGAYNEEITKRETAQANGKRLAAQLADLQNDVRLERENLASTQEELVRQQEAVAAQTSRNAALVADVNAKRSRVSTEEAQVQQAERDLGSREELRDLVAKLRTQREELTQISDELATAEAHVANLTAEAARIESVAVGLRAQTAWAGSRTSNPSLRTTIRSVYPTWGFVTLSSGDNAGVVTGSTLEVRRGGEPIAELLVTAVETTTAAADIVPDSTNGNQVRLRSGDVVVPAPAKSGGSSARSSAARSAPASLPGLPAPASPGGTAAAGDPALEEALADDADAVAGPDDAEADPFGFGAEEANDAGDDAAGEPEDAVEEDPFGN